MRTCTVNRYRCAFGLTAWLLLAYCSAFAQQDEYYQEEPTLEKGYWRLATSPDQRSTKVLFYNHQSQLIYQETLSGYYVSLNQRTADLLDDFLNRLERHQFLSEQLQGHLKPFPTILERPRRGSDLNQELVRSDTTSLDVQNQIHCSINPSGILRLNLLNPMGDLLAIRLVDDLGRKVYSKLINEAEFFSRLDVSSLANGRFQLSISNQKGVMLHTFTVVKSTHVNFTLQPMPKDLSFSIVP